jgi:hypothetical protein
LFNDEEFAALRATGFGDLATITGAVDFSLIEPNDVPLVKMFIKFMLDLSSLI